MTLMQPIPRYDHSVLVIFRPKIAANRNVSGHWYFYDLISRVYSVF
jgi:hypothetical protein